MSNLLDNNQLKLDSEYLRKLRGYCHKPRLSIDNLPNNNAFRVLSMVMNRLEQNPSKVSVSDCKDSLAYIWVVAYRLEAYIEQQGGPRRVDYVSKLSSEEIEIRIRGDYSHRKRPRPEIIKFSNDDFKRLANSLEVDEIDKQNLMFINEAINIYRLSVWDSTPSREDDLDKLSTLKRQINRVLDNIGRLCEMAVNQYKYSNCSSDSKLQKAVLQIKVLLKSVDLTILRIKKMPRKHKQHEVELTIELLDEYRNITKKNPSSDPRRGSFMQFLSVLEDILDHNEAKNYRRIKNRIGSELVRAILKNNP
jgi:hypothetical protein